MNFLCYSLFILLAWSSPGCTETLAQIEEKLAVRINGVEEPDRQVSSTDITAPRSNNSLDIPPPNQYSSEALRLDFEKRSITKDSLNHPFSVQVGSSRSLKLCYRVASMLREVGYPAFNSSIRLSTRGIWHRVYIGSFATRDSAQKVKEQLFAENITEGFIRHLSYAVQVGISGNFEQLQSLHQSLLATPYLPYSTPIHNASSGLVEGRLLIGACYKKEDCDLLLSSIADEGFSAVVVER